jgi:predicted DNA-binding transcriptional regulator YafY
MEFCRLGDRVEVLEPEDLRRAVADELEKASKQYR